MAVKIIIDGQEITIGQSQEGRSTSSSAGTELYLHGNLIKTLSEQVDRETAIETMKETLGVTSVELTDTEEEDNKVKYYFRLPVAEKG